MKLINKTRALTVLIGGLYAFSALATTQTPTTSSFSSAPDPKNAVIASDSLSDVEGRTDRYISSVLVYQRSGTTYMPDVTSALVLQQLGEEMRHKRNASNTWAVVQLMYDEARSLTGTAQATAVTYANYTAKTVPSYGYSPGQNTIYWLNVLAVYIRNKDLMDAATQTAVKTYCDTYCHWNQSGGTSNLLLIWAAQHYLANLAWGRNDDKGTGRAYVIQVAGTPPGEYASDPYGAQNLAPFLIVANCLKAQRSGTGTMTSDEATLWKGYISGLNYYSYTWLQGHLVAFSTRTYGLATNQHDGHGIKGLLSFHFGPDQSPVNSSWGIIGTSVHHAKIDFENQGLVGATYPVSEYLADIIDSKGKITFEGYKTVIDRANSDIFPRYGWMRPNDPYWQYYLDDTYGVYTERTPIELSSAHHGYIPMQTRPSGVMWSSAAPRSNFFLAIPNNTDLNATDYLVEQYHQQWFQHKSTFVLVTDNVITGTPPTLNYIFGSMPSFTSYSGSAESPHSLAPQPKTIVTGTTTISTGTTTVTAGPTTIYRQYYALSKEDAAASATGTAACTGTTGAVLICVTSPYPFNHDWLTNCPYITSGKKTTYNYYNAQSFRVILGNDSACGVAVETANAADYATNGPGKTLGDTLINFVNAVSKKTKFIFEKPGTGHRSRITYTNLDGDTLVKEFVYKGNYVPISGGSVKNFERVILSNSNTFVQEYSSWPSMSAYQ